MMQAKKNNLIMTLEIIRKNSDENHRLTQQKIIEYLQKQYDIKCDRKTVKRNIMNLVEFGYPINYNTVARGEGEIVTDIYYEHDLTDSEIKLVSDALLFSKYIHQNYTKKLIKQLETYASPFMTNELKNSLNFASLGHTDNADVFLSVETLNTAITKGRQVTLEYYQYVPSGDFVKKREEPYVINPYYTVTSNGRYYLICNVDKHDSLSNFRIDKIKNVNITQKPAKDIRKTKGNKNGFELEQYMKEHIYMFQGEIVRAVLELDSYLIGQVIDSFGKDYKLVSENGSKCRISLKVDEESLFCWAMQYGANVTVISPQKLRDKIKAAAENMVERYK